MKFRARELGLFLYWMKEREKIYRKRQAGGLPPWTTDKILQVYKFTNVFRQNDRVTKVLTGYLNGNLGASKGLIFGNIAVFRMFNWPPTYAALGGWRIRWDTDKALTVLRSMKSRKEQIFTGAYIITNAGSTRPKIELVCEAIGCVWQAKAALAARVYEAGTVEKAVELLTELPLVGRFIAYELACDLRHTSLLGHATDVKTWANLGPGADRGLRRLLHGTVDAPRIGQKRGVEVMRELLPMASPTLGNLEMREIEHSLCEFDKYMRVKNGEGRPRSKFQPH